MLHRIEHNVILAGEEVELGKVNLAEAEALKSVIVYIL